MEDLRFAWPFMIPIVAIIGAFAAAIVATLAKARVREAEIRERIAMIERGLVPPPEVDPKGFDTAMRTIDRVERLRAQGGGRHRRAGIILMGIGFGLMVLISFAGGAPEEGIGVGGFLVIVGVAFFVNSLFEKATDSPVGAPPTQPPPASHS